MAKVNKYWILRKKILLLTILRRRSIKRKSTNKKSMWVRRLFLERERHGEFQRLVLDLLLFDSVYFFKNFRMCPEGFENLLSWIAPSIVKSSKRRPTTSPAERLIITLRYLATGDAQFTIATSYRVSPTTITRIIRETTSVIWDVLCNKGYLLTPKSKVEWKKIANEFHELWNFPNCLGAIDGKHVIMQAPLNSGSLYFNYKKSFSIVLWAVCNAKYEFTLVDIGQAGRNSDSGIYNSSSLGKAIDQNLLDFPGMTTLPGYTEELFPHVFVADEGFALKPNMMRPYSRSKEFEASEFIFNYRLSRARRIIENTFGILATRFRIFRRPIIACVENAKNITKACLALHNFLMKTNFNKYFPNSRSEIEFEDVRGMNSLLMQGSRNPTIVAKDVRDQFKEYFVSEAGSVPWQSDVLNPN